MRCTLQTLEGRLLAFGGRNGAGSLPLAILLCMMGFASEGGGVALRPPYPRRDTLETWDIQETSGTLDSANPPATLHTSDSEGTLETLQRPQRGRPWSNTADTLDTPDALDSLPALATRDTTATLDTLKKFDRAIALETLSWKQRRWICGPPQIPTNGGLGGSGCRSPLRPR